MTLTLSVTSAAGTPFTGTISPGQPGREVRIEHHMPGTCANAIEEDGPCNEWPTVKSATLVGDGTSFTVTARAPAGTYRASIGSLGDSEMDLYEGFSPEVTIGG